MEFVSEISYDRAMTSPVNVLKYRGELRIDGRTLESWIDDAIQQATGGGWTERKDASLSIPDLKNSVATSGEHAILMYGCHVPGDLGIRFRVAHEGEFVTWTVDALYPPRHRS